MKNKQIIPYCRICGEEYNLETVFDFGKTALANSYLNAKQKSDIESGKIEEFKSNLSYFFCKTCGCFQLKEIVDPNILFKNYLYASSSSGNLREYFKNYCEDVIKRFNLKEPGKFVTVVASNDGVELENFARNGIECLGVEPATNLYEIANKRGLPTLNMFFNKDCAKVIIDNWGKSDLIMFNNVAAHIPNIHEFFDAIKMILKDDGIIVFENFSLLSMLQSNSFDVCLSPGQLIVTDKGMKEIENITLNDKVLSHTGKFKKVTHLFKNEYSSDIINILSYGQNIPLKLTPNHPVYVFRDNKNQFIKASDIKVGDKVLKSCLKHEENLSNISINHVRGNSKNSTEYNFNIDEKLCKIFGYYLAEGHYVESKGEKKSAEVTFSFGKSESEKLLAEDCLNCILSHNSKATIHYTRYGWHVYTHGGMARLLNIEFGTGAFHKNLPGWIFSLNKDLTKVILESYAKGDGYIYRNKGYLRISTISPKLAQGIAILANKLGYPCSINIGKVLSPRKIANNKNISILKYGPIDILIRMNQIKKCKVYCDGINQYNLVKSVTTVPYNGYVYNLEVEDDNSYTTVQSCVHNCYHEHFFKHSCFNLNNFLDSKGFVMLDWKNIEEEPHEGYFICYARLKRTKDEMFLSENVVKQILEEKEVGINKIDYYKKWTNNLENIRYNLLTFITTEMAKGKTFCAYGYPAKATTLCKYFEIGDKFKYVVENSKVKQGLFTPEYHVQIVDSEYFKQNPTDYCIVLAWNFYDLIVKNNLEYKGKWVNPFNF